jgi:endonuclease/exonuclease/phosphatase family metal-dependent hydrolase
MKKAISIVSLGILLVTGQAVPAIASTNLVNTQTVSTLPPIDFKTTDQTPYSVGLTWSAVTNAPQYRVQFSKNSDMSEAWYARSFGSTPNIDIRDLSPGTPYYFKVRVINTDGSNISPYSSSITVTTKPQPAALPAIEKPLKVATFNVRCANCNGEEPEYLPWDKRRDAVISQIKSKMPDVIGLQEASQGWLKDPITGTQINLSQFEDLQQRLNTAGAPYALTNSSRNNCVNSFTPTNCTYADQGASQDAKIIYNKNTVSLVSQGSTQLPANDPTANARYVSWAILQQTSTNKKFFVADTHLQPGDGTANYDARKSQAQKMVEVINSKNPEKLPTFIVGDMNASKWSEPDNAPYEVFTKAGYVDPIGGTAFTSVASGYAVAEKMINAKYSSYNGFDRQLSAPADASNRYLGRHIDYIFTSKMRVGAWEQVLNVDSNGLLQGVIPSDHNMLMTTVELPNAPVAPVLSAIAKKALLLNGSLGVAVGKEVYTTNGGGYQKYEKGFILWHPRTGAFENKGSIRSKWAGTGYENGWMGYPKTDEIASINGGVYQVYEGGAIYWAPNCGTHISFGGIRSMYGSMGYEKGRLGYPTSDEYKTATGVSQNFQGGKINWSATNGNSIILK